MNILLSINETTQLIQETTTRVANEITTQLANETVNQISNTAQKVSITKDIFWIIFTLIATVIAVLTFFNAKKSLFHPLHSEVIKRQTDRFVEVYDLISGNIFDKIDYNTIFNICFYYGLKELGYSVEIPENAVLEYDSEYGVVPLVFGVPIVELDDETISEFDEELQQQIRNSLSYSDETLTDDPIEEVLDDYEFRNRTIEETIPNQIRHIISTVCIKGKPVHLGYIPNTEKATTFFNKLDLLRNDPLLPTEFRSLLNSLYDQAEKNILEVLSNQVDFAIGEIWEYEEISNDEIESISVNTYNDMVERFNDHNKVISEITKMINTYLKIDKLFK